MKTLSRSLCLLALSTPALAQDYQAALQSIQDRQKSIDHQMAHFGFSAGLGSAADNTVDRDKKIQASLFQVHDQLNAVRIPAGKLLFGKTYLKLVVTTEGTPAMVLLDEGQGFLSGLKLLGKARPSSTEGRLHLDLDRVLLRSGRTIPIQGSALDPSGAYGLEAQVWSNKAWVALGAVASSFVSGAAASQQSLTSNAFGFSQTQPTGRNAILQGLAQSAADQSKKLMDDATREKPIHVVEADTPVTVLINEEVRQ